MWGGLLLIALHLSIVKKVTFELIYINCIS